MTLFTNKQDRHLPLLTQFYQLDVVGVEKGMEEYAPQMSKGSKFSDISGKSGSKIRRERFWFEPEVSEEEPITPELDRFLYLFQEGFTDEAYEFPLTWTQTEKQHPNSAWQSKIEELHSAVCDLMDAVVQENDSSLDPENRAWNHFLRYRPQRVINDLQRKSFISHTNNNESVSTSNTSNTKSFLPYRSTLVTLNNFVARYIVPPHFRLNNGSLNVELEGHKTYLRPATPRMLIVEVLQQLLAFVEAGRQFQVCEECRSTFQPIHEERRFCSYRCTARAGQRRRRKHIKEEFEIENEEIEGLDD